MAATEDRLTDAGDALEACPMLNWPPISERLMDEADLHVLSVELNAGAAPEGGVSTARGARRAPR